MSHEIMMKNNVACFAFTGERDAIWHQLGQQMPADADLEAWRIAAGMDYTVQRGFVRYASERGGEPVHTVDDRIVLHRSDNGAPLGIVSDKFQVVQPSEVLEFFSDLLGAAGFSMDTAGVLYGGKKFFATAKVGSATIGNLDRVNGNLLVSTACDGSSATEVGFVATRVVCANTLAIALGEKRRNTIRITHRSEFDAASIKINLGIAAENAMENFVDAARYLSSLRISSANAAARVQSLLLKANQGIQLQPAEIVESGPYKKILDLFEGQAIGANLASAAGTGWGLLNAVTEYVDHHGRAKDSSNRVNNALWGPGAKLKTVALESLLAA